MSNTIHERDEDIDNNEWGDLSPEDEKLQEGLVVEFLGPFVNVYRIDKAYGGPEEGGWWYEYGEALRSKQVLPDDEEAIEAEKAKQQAWCDEQNQGRRTDINSVLSEGKYVVRVEDWPAEDYPRETPHYE